MKDKDISIIQPEAAGYIYYYHRHNKYFFKNNGEKITITMTEKTDIFKR
jgi:hypothetical protein